ncbi:MAG: glucose-1-phosphate adenylyltransferase subunit GlgD [Peptoniphilaceae bacterium]|nr:glucose-1-phosphate adenylyltransferase subunit GlgD [Peptoniphilaceae bacterium]MDD7383536.1 glucose-1-phosphate adenylyltransferase subunit GlgD [Peptoniphilaceae bacterium]MDY3738709.1 glucose-1-phosphate adenylyltransferase subunit GlgD [Peptoniphilaceae bacterium]
MKNITALVYSHSDHSKEYGSLTKNRPDYMLPYGGRYRLIDFAFSNLTNFGISSVVLYTDKNLRSTLDHIGNGESWELNRRNGGLVFFPPDPDKRDATEIETYYESLKFFLDSNEEYIFITDPMYLSKPDISGAYEKMLNEDRDVMVFYKRINDEYGEYINKEIINVDKDGNAISSGINLGSTNIIDLFAGSILIKKSVFLNILKYSIERSSAQTILEGIFKYNKPINISLYETEKRINIISDLSSFYSSNMNLLDQDVFDSLFYEDGMVYTKSKDEPSTIYLDGAEITNSLVANGCIIEGEVVNSIIFRGVKIKKGAIIRNSIVFQEAEIGEDSIINNTIIDKYGIVGDNTNLAGSRANPYIVEKGKIVKEF